MEFITFIRMVMAGLDDYTVLEPIMAELEEYYTAGPVAAFVACYRYLEIEDKFDQLEDEIQQAYDTQFYAIMKGIELDD